MEEHEFENIIELLKSKASVKQDVFANTKESFCFFKETTKSYIDKLSELYKKTDERVEIKLEDISDYEFRILIGGDILVFHMHTNVFQFPKSHYMGEYH